MSFRSKRARSSFGIAFLTTVAAALCGLSAGYGDSKAAKSTGEGVVIRSQDETTRVAFGAALRCGPMPVRPPNHLEIEWNGNQFALETVTNSYCDNEGAADPGSPKAPHNTLWLTGVGSYNGRSGHTIVACLTDAGESGNEDDFAFVLHDPEGKEVYIAGGKLVSGNIQAHK